MKTTRWRVVFCCVLLRPYACVTTDVRLSSVREKPSLFSTIWNDMLLS